MAPVVPVSSAHGLVVVLSIIAPLASLFVAGLVLWHRHVAPTRTSPFASIRSYFWGDLDAASTESTTEEETDTTTPVEAALPKGVDMDIYNERA